MGSGAHQVQLSQSESELLPGWILCVQGRSLRRLPLV
jgi:hypothetical protein